MNEPEFWFLSSPDYEDDYTDVYVNGYLYHAAGLPGIDCATCGHTWSGWRTLPFRLPDDLIAKLSSERGALPSRAYSPLRDEVQKYLLAHGSAPDRLRPGDRFQPSYLDIPSRPSDDFLWSGTAGTVVVSQRIKKAFESARVTGVTFCPIALRKVGKGSPTAPPPVPDSGEPEDVFESVSYLRWKRGIGPYYEMVPLGQSAAPHGSRITSSCPDCGWEKVEGQELAMYPDMWRGEDVFLLATTLHIVVTRKVQENLTALRATNVVLAPPRA